jgi:hypothetical protein
MATFPVSAASWSTPRKVAGPGYFWTSSVASENNTVVVGWLQNYGELVYRVSLDRGHTFAPPVSVGGGNPGAVTVCGGLVAAVRVNTGNGSVTLDLRETDGTPVETRTLASGRNLDVTGNNIVCVAGRRVATFWDEWISGVLHLKVAVVPVAEPLTSYEFDLGAAHLYRIRGITATDSHIWVAFSRSDGIIVQRLDVGSGPLMKVSKGPRARIARSVVAPGVSVAAVGNRVYVSYDRNGSGFIRISKDGGKTFGIARSLVTSPDGPAGPWTLVARENVVVAAVHIGPWCGGCVGSNKSVYSTNYGRDWTSGPVNTGGYMVVGMLGSGPGMRIMQAWDNRTAVETYGDPGFMKFQLGTP